MDYLKGLNVSQVQAVQETEGYLRIIAGAGTGKTRVITHRIAYLIATKHVAPYRILALTFTNKAAKEMKMRTEQLLQTEKSGVVICTFHALCVRILKEDIEHLHYPKSFLILDGDDQKAILKPIYKQLNVDVKAFPYPSMLSFISQQKSNHIETKTLIDELNGLGLDTTRAVIYDLYEKEKIKQYALDFDDLLIMVAKLFKAFPSILEKWQSRYDYIHVDEFQDTNDIQFEIVEQLCAKCQNLCVVGDGDQTIYTWRGANAKLILEFDQLFKNVKTITLEKNYRSTKSILAVANKLIGHNKMRLKKDLNTENEQGSAIEYVTFMSPEQEANYACVKISDMMHNMHLSRYDQFAILYRSNYLSRPFEQALIAHQIPYRLFGGTKFFERKEVKDMLAYLRLCEFEDDLSFLRVINTPKRGIGDKTIEQIRLISLTHEISLLDATKQMTFSASIRTKIDKLLQLLDTTKTLDAISEKLEYLFEHSGYKEMLKLDNDDTRLSNVQELIQSVITYETENETLNTEDYLHEIALYTGGDEKDEGSYVSLLTIHAAKGLEFDYVFLVGLNQEDFPSQRALEDSQEKIEEERRLAYVAFTRAKQQLFLSGNSGYHFFNQSYRSPSMFVDEALQQSDKPAFLVRKKQPTFTQQETMQETFESISLALHDQVVHQKYGKGVVVKVEDDTLQVAFGVEFGIKTMIANSKFLKKVTD